MLRSDNLDHLIDRRLVLARIGDAQVSEAVLLIIRDEFVLAVHPDHTASDQAVGLFDDPHCILQKIGTHAFVGIIRSSELTEKVALSDVVVWICVHLLAQRSRYILVIGDVETSDGECKVAYNGVI